VCACVRVCVCACVRVIILAGSETESADNMWSENIVI